MFVRESIYREQKRLRETAERELAAERRLREQAEAREAGQQVVIDKLQAQTIALIQMHQELQIDLLDRFEPKPVHVAPDEAGDKSVTPVTGLTVEQVEGMHVIGKRGQRLRRHLLKQAKELEARNAAERRAKFASAEAPAAAPDPPQPAGVFLDDAERTILETLISGDMRDFPSTEADN